MRRGKLWIVVKLNWVAKEKQLIEFIDIFEQSENMSV